MKRQEAGKAHFLAMFRLLAVTESQRTKFALFRQKRKGFRCCLARKPFHLGGYLRRASSNEPLAAGAGN